MKYIGMLSSRTVFILFSLCCFSAGTVEASYENYTFTQLAGPVEVPGWHDGTDNNARFAAPHKLAFDRNGNTFVADYGNHTIRKISPAGVVTTMAGLAGNPGSTDGMGSAARFNNPAAIAVDSSGNVLVADYGNHTIRRITTAGMVTTVAGKAGALGKNDGNGTSARFHFPIGLVTDDSGNLFVADAYNHAVRKITSDGKVTTFAGKAGFYGSADGTGAAARFTYPFGITADPNGNLYVSEVGNNIIRKITSSGVVSTLAGTAGQSGTNDGTGVAARFNQPFDIIFGQGNLFVSDTYNHTIRQIALSGEVTTLAGVGGTLGNDNGTGDAARFHFPTGVGIDDGGNVHVADYGNNLIRKISSEREVTSLAGNAGGIGSKDGPGDDARFNFPAGIAIDQDGASYVADLANHTIRKITAAGEVITFAGSAGSAGAMNGTGSEARFRNPLGVAVDAAGTVFVADYGNNTIRKITPTGDVTTLAGSPGNSGSADGEGTDARFFSPFFLTVDSSGIVFVADTWNHTIRKITPDGTVTTLAGKAGNPGKADGMGADARFNYPEGIAADSDGNLFVADNANHTIRKITPTGNVTTYVGLAGTSGDTDGIGSSARFKSPFGLSIDSLGNLFVVDYGNHLIRKITPSRVVTTLAGASGKPGNRDGNGIAALFSSPEGIAVDADGALFVTDSGNHSIRKGLPALPDSATVDLPIGQTGTARQLSVNNLTTTSWTWRIIRQPANSTAQLSATNIVNPTFTPDVVDRYILRFEGKDNLGRVVIDDVTIDARSPDILSLTTSGQGTVSPNYNNSKLVIGKTYTITAKPVKGYIFTGWTGDVESSSAKLTFVMSDNLVLQANFIPDPFPPVAGVYQGLFFQESEVMHQSSGFFSANVTTKGAMSAKIQLAGKTYSLSGSLSATGALSKTIARKDLPALSVQLQVDLNGGDRLTGQISDGNWSANLTGDRNIFSKNLPATAVKYTLAFPGNDDAQLPGGNGFATITTDVLGKIKLAGTLGDGTKISQSGIRSKQSDWPFYVSLYSGNGSILSWLTFTGNSITNSDGVVSWIKLPQPKSKTYPSGFTNELNVAGFIYRPTNGVALLNFTNGQIEFTGGNLTSDFSNQFSISAADKVISLSSNKLTLTLTRASGLFKGTVVNPATQKSISFSGALIQDQSVGYGFFTGTNQTGGVSLGGAVQ